MAIGFLLMLVSGVVMTYAPLTDNLQFRLYQWHKSLGILLLLCGVIRLSVRLFSQYRGRVPPLPSRMKPLERLAAHWGHVGLYALLFLMPLTGWVMVSASIYGLPTYVFGWFEWPHLPGIARSESVEALAKTAHFYGAIFFGLLIMGHIAAVIKHSCLEQLNLLPRILWPALPKKLLGGVAVSLLAVSGGALLLEAIAPTEPTNLVSEQGAGNYKVLHDRSRISFSGKHTGDPFEGHFQRWQADLNIDLRNLPESHVKVVIDMDSATTGNPMYDGTLVEEDWFHTQAFPKATFETTHIQFDRTEGFFATGDLTIRSITHPVTLFFTTSDLQTLPITLETTVAIDRLDFEVGLSSDPAGDWVSKEIMLKVMLTVTQ